jgi:hypothetical protein
MSNAKQLAAALAKMGRKGDTVLAHINPAEAALLDRMTNGGSVNPKTGLLEFYDPEVGDYGQDFSAEYSGVPNSQESSANQSFPGFDAGQTVSVGTSTPSEYDAQFKSDYRDYEKSATGATPGGELGDQSSIFDGWGPTIGSTLGGIAGMALGGPFGGALGSGLGRYLGGGTATGSVGTALGSAIGGANPLLSMVASGIGGRAGDFIQNNTTPQQTAALPSELAGFPPSDPMAPQMADAESSGEGAMMPDPMMTADTGAQSAPAPARGFGGMASFSPWNTAAWSGVGDKLTNPGAVTVPLAQMLQNYIPRRA